MSPRDSNVMGTTLSPRMSGDVRQKNHRTQVYCPNIVNPQPTMTNTLYYGDNLDPPFNSNASCKVLFKEQNGHVGVDAGVGWDE